MPLASVVITTYNRAEMLNEALASVFAQTFRDFEVVVVDDGSTDHTRAVVERYADRVRYRCQAHSGRTCALNGGIAMATGKYVAFLDDDDRWLPRKLERQVSALEQSPGVDVVYGPIFLVGDATRTIWGGDAPESATLCERLLTGRFVCTPSGIMLRRTILDRAGPFDARLWPCDDWEMWIRIALAGGRFRHLDEPLVEYRVHSRNTSSDIECENAARIAVLAKVFDAPGVARHWQVRKRYYLSRQWRRIGDGRYVRSQLHAARAAWWRAVRTDPAILTPGLASLMLRTLLGARALAWGRGVRDALGVRRPRLHAGR